MFTVLLQAGLGNATAILLVIGAVATLIVATVIYFIMKFLFKNSNKEPKNFFVFLGKFTAIVILLAIVGFAIFSILF